MHKRNGDIKHKKHFVFVSQGKIYVLNSSFSRNQINEFGRKFKQVSWIYFLFPYHGFLIECKNLEHMELETNYIRYPRSTPEAWFSLSNSLL